MAEIVDIGYAAKNLPEGWQLCIEIEKGSADFCLYDPDGNKNCDFCDDDLTTHEMLKQRVDRAVGVEREAAKRAGEFRVQITDTVSSIKGRH